MQKEAYLLITTPYKSSSLIATFLTEDSLVKAICYSVKKGSKNIGSDLGGVAKLSLTLTGNGELYTLKESSIIDDYDILQKNMQTSLIISYIRETILYISQGGDYEKKYFLLMEKSFLAMKEYIEKNMTRTLKPFLRAFEIKAVSAAGIAPIVERCSLCGNEKSALWNYNFDESGVICTNCFDGKIHRNTVELSFQMLSVIQKLKHKRLIEVISEDFCYDEKTDERIKKITRNTLYSYIGKSLKSAKIIDSMVE